MASNSLDGGDPAADHVSTREGACNLSIAYRPIIDLKPDPKNPRSHSPKQVRQIGKSIRQFGFVAPVLVDRHDNVVAGHGRLLAAGQLGLSVVPAICLDHLTPAQAKALRIACNRLTEGSEWNDRLLAEAFQELSFQDLDFDLDVTGFELPEIDLRIESLNVAEADDDESADQVPAPDATAVTKADDVWILGKHRLLCASALEAASYQVLLNGGLADFVFTDPPYNVPIRGHVSGNGAVQHREFVMGSGEMTEAQFGDFLRTLCRLLAAHSAAGSVHDICMDWRHVGELLAAGKAAYSTLLNVCVWTKQNAGMGSLYRSQHELVLVFKNGEGPHTNNVQLGKFGRNRTNVWTYPGINNFGRGTEEGNLLAMHPTVKPLALVVDAILDCSKRGDTVLDPFLGSGTTLIACERTGRVCRGIELDPLYVDTVIRRWQKYTGDGAVNAITGRTFAEHEAEVSRG
jgi:DNA modification methylase